MRKKILLGVLALSTIITAAGIEDVMNEVNNKYGYASGNLKISAEVVAPITLEVEELDFGTVPMGKIKDTPMKEGKIKIEGAAGKNVQLFFYPTGSGSAVYAIDYLKNSGVKDIIFMCLVAAPEGIAKLLNKHPDVAIYTAKIDQGLTAEGYIYPGLGDCGDRIFGTK